MSEFNLNKLGMNIRNARKNKGFSQEKLAELLGCSRNYVGMIERAEVNVPSATVIEIAKILNIDIKELYSNFY